jgi:hypothetical protein
MQIPLQSYSLAFTKKVAFSFFIQRPTYMNDSFQEGSVLSLLWADLLLMFRESMQGLLLDMQVIAEKAALQNISNVVVQPYFGCGLREETLNPKNSSCL